MSDDLIPFDNGEFHVEMTPIGDTFNVRAPGLSRALGFRESYDMLRGIPDTEKGSEIVRTLGGDQRVGYVTEAGFYRALGQRQAARITDPNVRAAVERFQAWVYGDVLPALRRREHRGAVAKLTNVDLARMVIEEADRADRNAERAQVAEKFRTDIEGADGLTPTEFHKKYFPDAGEREFFEHLYRHKLLINQRRRGRYDPATGEHRDGPEHRHPTALGKRYFYLHAAGVFGGKRRENTRVRPAQPELDLRDLLVSQGLPANNNDGPTVIEDGAA